MSKRFYSTQAWKALRLECFKRDTWRCTNCGISVRGKKHGGSTPNADHIKPLRTHPELGHELSNLRTLCISCHTRRTRLDKLAEGKPLIGPDGYAVEETE